MISPIYFFTKSGCAWSAKMLPSINLINKTLNEEQRIEIHNIDDEKSQEVYENTIKRLRIEPNTPMMYNSNLGSVLSGYHDEIQIRKFLKSEKVPEVKPISPMPQFLIKSSSKKDFDNWKNSVILWYDKNKNDLPPNVVSKEKVIDMVYNQFMAYRTKPLTIEERFSKLEEQSQEYDVRYEKMNKELKNLKLQIKKLKRLK